MPLFSFRAHAFYCLSLTTYNNAWCGWQVLRSQPPKRCMFCRPCGTFLLNLLWSVKVASIPPHRVHLPLGSLLSVFQLRLIFPMDKTEHIQVQFCGHGLLKSHIDVDTSQEFEVCLHASKSKWEEERPFFSKGPGVLTRHYVISLRYEGVWD